jgi:hypothetical protein
MSCICWVYPGIRAAHASETFAFCDTPRGVLADDGDDAAGARSATFRHEVSEEEILRPVSKRAAGEEIANARIHEESQAEELLKEMENLDTDSAEFAAKLAILRQEVENHAEAEETQEFPKVAEKESPERLEQMGKVFEVAKKAAPTRPHPSTPNTPVANMMVGPFAAVLDRTRDAVRNAMKSSS